MSEEHPHGLGRRQFLKAIGAGMVTLRSLYHLRGILDPFEVMAAEPAHSTIPADEALRRLVAGNQRALAGRFTLVDRIAQARRQTVQAQHPRTPSRAGWQFSRKGAILVYHDGGNRQ